MAEPHPCRFFERFFELTLKWVKSHVSPIIERGALQKHNKIVVGLTARGKDADKFWFSLFHELAHIILGHVGQNDGTTEDDENDANAWSRDTLIPEKVFEEFRVKSNYSEISIRAFAKEQCIAPGIVVGRLQNEGCIQYNMLN